MSTTAHKSFKISDSLYLVYQQVPQKTQAAKPVEVPTDHIAVIDCSGSMYNDLPKIREQLKRKVPKMLKETDTLSIVWFSGRGQCGTLLEGEPVATLSDLKQVEQTIDRWLRSVGMTGFKEPLLMVSDLAKKLAKKRPSAARSLIFMSDGCDNQWGRAEILKAVEAAASEVQSATFVEYGYYADRPLLTHMAEKSGGALIFAEDFDRYEPAFESAITKKVAAKRIEVPVKGDPIGGFAYALVDNDLLTFTTAGGSITIPEHLQGVYYLSPSAIGEKLDRPDLSHCPAEYIHATYAALSLFATRMKPEIVFPLLKATGDVAFIEQFANCFGKQKYSTFMEETKAAAFDSKKILTKGYDPNKVPREDAFTVLDVLNLLQQDSATRIFLDSPQFKYSKIGRGRVDAVDQLTDEEQAEVDKIREEIGKTKDSKAIKELSARIAAIADKPEALKFVKDAAPDGYPILKLTFNEDRPNVSFLVRIPGKVDISARLKAEGKSGIPSDFETFVFRNYAVIKDGLVNIETLPVRVSTDTYEKLIAEGVLQAGAYERHGTPATVDIDINLRSLPVINRKMVRAISAKTFFECEYELSRAQAAQKVYKDYVKTLFPPKKSEGFAEKYGDDGATWLKTIGFTDYNGYSPTRTVTAPATDVYMGKELKVSLKGLSTLPKVAEVKEKIAKNAKLNAPGALMAQAVKEVEAFLKSEAYTKAKAKDNVLKAWLEGQAEAAINKSRDLLFQIAQATFCVVVGQVWFNEFSSLDENEMAIDVDGNKIACKVEMREIEIKI